MSGLFLIKVRKEWPALYWFSIIYCLGVFFSAFILKQTITPFFVFQMYSYPQKAVPVYDSMYLEINGQPLPQFNFPKEKDDIITSNCSRYLYLKHNNLKDKYFTKLKEMSHALLPDIIYQRVLSYPNLKREFGSWLKRYLEKNSNIKIFSIKLYAVSIKYEKNGRVQVIAKTPELICK